MFPGLGTSSHQPGAESSTDFDAFASTRLGQNTIPTHAPPPVPVAAAKASELEEMEKWLKAQPEVIIYLLSRIPGPDDCTVNVSDLNP